MERAEMDRAEVDRTEMDRAEMDRMTRRVLGVVICLLALACSDAAGPPLEREIFVEAPGGGVLLPGEPSYDDAGNLIEGGDPAGARILVISGDREHTVNVGARLELGALLFDARGDPIEGEQIAFTFGGDEGDASLEAQRVFTDDTGFAAVQLTASSDVRDFEINAQGNLTRTVTFTIHVVELPTGGLEIAFDYAAPVALGLTEVYLIDDRAWCEFPNYLRAPNDVLSRDQVPSPASTVDFGPILAGTRVSIVVRARLAETGTLAAGGCFGDVEVPEAETRRVVVPLLLLPLNPAGVYTVQNHFDFTDAIPGTLGDVIDGLVRFFGDQNHQREIGGLVINLVRGWLEDDLDDIINNYIENDSPQWMRDFFLIGSDLVSVVSNMEVVSRMRISKPLGDGAFNGSQNWIGLGFTWRLPCQGMENPPEDCGHHAFTMDELVEGADGIDLVFGQFSGRVAGYNEGVIDRHTLDLQYGRLILFVLNHLILPAVADGAENLSDALLNLANCPAFANGITGGNRHLRIAGINIVSRDRIEGWCVTVMSVAGDAASAILGRLRIDTRLSLEGRVTLVEETDDLLVDRLVDGVWRGVIRTAEDEGAPFEGDFSGSRDE